MRMQQDMSVLCECVHVCEAAYSAGGCRSISYWYVCRNGVYVRVALLKFMAIIIHLVYLIIMSKKYFGAGLH